MNSVTLDTSQQKLHPWFRYNVPGTIVLTLGSLFIIVPLYFVLSMSLKTSADGGSGFSLPSTFHWENYAAAWVMVNAPVAFAMSVVISLIAVVGNILLSAMVAWTIVRNWYSWLFRGCFIYLLAAMFIPFTTLALPQVKLMATIGLDNPIGVGLLHVMFGLSFNTLLFAAYIRSLPVELEESAMLDGCSTFQVFWKIVLPLLTPMAATVGIFAFLTSWNDYFMPSLIISNVAQQTLPVVQATYANSLTLDYNVAFASYAIAMLPAIIGYLIGQRWIIAGVMRGAIK